MSFTADLLTGVATLLAGSSIGLSWRGDGSQYQAGETGLFLLSVPPLPDRLVTLTCYDLGDDPALSDSEKGLQVRSRSGNPDPRDVISIDDAIADVLLGNYPQTLSTGVRVTTLVRASSVPLGMDDNHRWSFASNYTLGLWRPSPHRI